MADQQTVYDPGPIALPSDRAWLDPALVGRNLYVRTSDIAIPFAPSTLVAKPDPARWAIGLTLSPLSGAGASAAPWSDLPGGTWNVLDVTRLDWYDLTRYGPLVMSGWYAAGGAGSIIRVIEIIRRT